MITAVALSRPDASQVTHTQFQGERQNRPGTRNNKYVIFRQFTIATNGLRCILHRCQYISYFAGHLFSPLTILYCFYINRLVLCHFLSYKKLFVFSCSLSHLPEMSNYSYFDTIRTYYFNLALYSSRYVLIKYSNRMAQSLRQALTDDARKSPNMEGPSLQGCSSIGKKDLGSIFF